MHQPNLEGTHYEMGQYYGAQLYERGFRITQLPRIKTDAKVIAESQRAVTARA